MEKDERTNTTASGPAETGGIASLLPPGRGDKERDPLYQRIWDETGAYREPGFFDTEGAWKRIDAANQRAATRRHRLRAIGHALAGAAAAITLLLGISLLTGFPGRRESSRFRVVATQGSRSEALLPDGSTVRLNAGSDLTYTLDPTGTTREVSFQGEGFFTVAKSDKPFVVRMRDGLSLTVHGTTFNLQAYADESTVRASLVEGSVELGHGGKRLLMRPGETAVFDRRTKEIRQVEGTVAHDYGWLDGKLYMDHLSLHEVCRHLERRFDVRIRVEGDLGRKIHYDGVIQEESLTDILEALSRLSAIRYSVKGKEIRITAKKTTPME